MALVLDPDAAMPSRIISERSFQLAVRIVKSCDGLRNGGRAARKIADQLFDCGTSIGANVSESQGGQTKPDVLARLAVSRKESWETIYWLRLAVATSIVTEDAVAWELDEAQQLKAMITARSRPVNHRTRVEEKPSMPKAMADGNHQTISHQPLAISH